MTRTERTAENTEERGTTMSKMRAGANWFVMVLVVGSLAAAAGCDVTNPGPVEDRFLNDPTARAGIVNGIKRAHSDALAAGCGAIIAADVASATREVFPSGNPGTCGIDTRVGVGDFRPDETGARWEAAQNARWVAEDALRRFQETMGDGYDSSPFVAEAMVWAGFGNRMLGENFCQVIFDGGSPQPHTDAFTRAEGHFTDAIAVAQAANEPDLVNAALAGRASVRASLGNWQGAVDDAQQVPVDFEFEAGFFNVSQDQYNQFSWATASEPYRTMSVWNTPYDQYFTDTGDPRVGWELDPDCSDPEPPQDGPGECFGDLARFDMRVPFHIQQKYRANGAAIDVADGREMLLIKAEALMDAGNWQAAMDTVNNGLRAPLGLDPWTPTDADSAWTLFRFERGIELWLEGRRMGDLRRWQEAGRPGQLQPLEDPSNSQSMLNSDRDL